MKILFNWIEFDDVENSFCSHFKNEYIKKALVEIFDSQRWRFWICADVIDGGGWRATSVHGNASCRKSFAKRVNQVHSSCAVCIRESTSILIASTVWHEEFSRDENITTNVQPIPYWMGCAHVATVQRTSSSCSCSRSMLYKIENPYRFSMPISSIYYVVQVLFKQIINFPGWLLLLFFFPCFFLQHQFCCTCVAFLYGVTSPKHTIEESCLPCGWKSSVVCEFIRRYSHTSKKRIKRKS